MEAAMWRLVTICAALMLVLAVANVEAKKKPAADPTTQPSDLPTQIKRGIKLADAERIAGEAATPVGGPKDGHQVYRLVVKQAGDSNDHPKTILYMLNVNAEGIILRVHKHKASGVKYVTCRRDTSA
jgi:hypothetical protein